MVLIHKSILLLRHGLCTVKECISAGPYRKRIIVTVRLLGAHTAIALKLRHVFFVGRVCLIRHRTHYEIAVGPLIVLPLLLQSQQALAHLLLHENVVVEPAIAVQNRHKARNLRTMMHVIRSITRRRLGRSSVIHTSAYRRKGACDKVVYQRNALGR